MYRIWVSRRTFSLIDNSSCSRTCSRRDSTYPCCASCNSNLWAEVCCWSSLMQLLRDSTWYFCFISSTLAWLSKWSLLPSRRDLPKFDGSAFLKTELLNWFPGSSLPNEYNAAGFSGALGSWDELDVKLFPETAWVRFVLAPLSCNSAASFPGAIGIREDSQSSRFCKYSGEANIFRSSPSSRSESAMLSAESSSQCTCDWK